MAEMLCEPFDSLVVSSEELNGETPETVAFRTESTRKSTFVTPRLSLAWTDTVIVPDTVAPFAGEIRLVVGAVTSALLTVTETGAAFPLFPAASYAIAATVCVPFENRVVSTMVLKGDAPVAFPISTESKR